MSSKRATLYVRQPSLQGEQLCTQGGFTLHLDSIEAIAVGNSYKSALPQLAVEGDVVDSEVAQDVVHPRFDGFEGQAGGLWACFDGFDNALFPQHPGQALHLLLRSSSAS